MPYPSLQDVVHDWQGEEGQTEATMLATQLEVIADELRTANLIALLNHVPIEQAEALLPRIAERLGLA